MNQYRISNPDRMKAEPLVKDDGKDSRVDDAWTYIAGIFQDNKRRRAMALKSELSNLKLGDLSIDGYFQKIESIVSVLNGSVSSVPDVTRSDLDMLQSLLAKFGLNAP
nr:hybrid signal transduction histidine kinase M [Tanacetum cinerariifolium]